jgi:chaperone required for assembly of F1-ATPase
VRRFYRDVAVVAPESEGAGAHAITLDDKPVRTPRNAPLRVPTADLAAAIAAEWQAQDERVDLARMPLTRFASTGIDLVPVQRDLVLDQIAAYAATDLLCYRATAPAELRARQAAVWQPLLDWLAEGHAVRLTVTEGLMPARQDPAQLTRLRAAVAGYADLALAPLSTITGACGSLVIALALAEARIDATAACAAAELDESWQNERWGEDPEALRRRQAVRDDVAAGARFLALLGEAMRRQD